MGYRTGLVWLGVGLGLGWVLGSCCSELRYIADRRSAHITASCVITYIQRFVEAHNGEWPRSWEQLQLIYCPTDDEPAATVFVDFDADPSILANQSVTEFTGVIPRKDMNPIDLQIQALIQTLKKYHD